MNKDECKGKKYKAMVSVEYPIELTFHEHDILDADCYAVELAQDKVPPEIRFKAEFNLLEIKEVK